MAETLQVELRSNLGKRNSRRLRRSGSVPVILYGHGQENVCLSCSAEALEMRVRHGQRLLQLTGAVSEQAFIRQLQWDTWGVEVVHVDLARVSEHERVEIKVPLELRGEAPGVKTGGVIKHNIHEVMIDCEVGSMPERLWVNVNHLELGSAIKASELVLPPGVNAHLDPDTVVVECVEPAAEIEEAAGEGGPVEPELIGRKKEEEGEEE